MPPSGSGEGTRLGGLTKALTSSEGFPAQALAAGLLPSQPDTLAVPEEATVSSCPTPFTLQLHRCPAKHPQKSFLHPLNQGRPKGGPAL